MWTNSFYAYALVFTDFRWDRVVMKVNAEGVTVLGLWNNLGGSIKLERSAGGILFFSQTEIGNVQLIRSLMTP